jgi:hypothetical protein
MDVLAGIFAAAALQDLAYTSKTALVSRGHLRLAVAADVCAMLTSSLYLILTAAVTMRSGLSLATVEAFAAIAVGGACGTVGGMFAVEWVERRLALKSASPRGAGAGNMARSSLFDLTKTLHRYLPGARAA